MEKEKYEPTPEEVEKAEEMAVEGEMTPEQEKMSKERSETFEAGEESERQKILHTTQRLQERTPRMKELGLGKIEDLIGMKVLFIRHAYSSDAFDHEGIGEVTNVEGSRIEVSIGTCKHDYELSNFCLPPSDIEEEVYPEEIILITEETKNRESLQAYLKKINDHCEKRGVEGYKI